MKTKRVRWEIFLPPWFIMIAAVILNLANYDLFVETLDSLVKLILNNFSWMFSGIALLAVLMVITAYLSPFRSVRIGGSKSKPILKYRDYIWVVLCTIMGAGLMLWACAEPLYHLYYPPSNVAGGAMSGDAIIWGMENIFLEWTFTPMAITALPAILFAFCFYNMKKPFAVGSMLTPVLGDKYSRKLTPWVDGICLFCLCAGLSGSLGSGIMLVSGGIQSLSKGTIPSSVQLWIISGIAIIAAFVTSAASGLNKGIKTLSTINSWFYLVLGMIVFAAGPTAYLLNLCSESIGAYLSDFFKLSLWTSASTGDGWAQSWPVFYWCMALSWMPVSAVFLGRVSRGYTVREILKVLFIIPSVFSIVWMVLFSGSSIYYEINGANVMEIMQTQGIDAAVYAVLRQLPLSIIVIPLFLLTAYISYVTSADSNTNAIAGLCTEGLNEEDTESPIWLKIVWGITVGLVSLIMLIAYDMEGMKKLAALGGFPAAILMIFFLVAFWKIMQNPQKYDTHKEDYDPQGKPIPSARNPVEAPVEK